MRAVQTELQTVQTELQTVQTELRTVQTELRAVRTELRAVRTETRAVRTAERTVRTAKRTVRTAKRTVRFGFASVRTANPAARSGFAAVRFPVHAALPDKLPSGSGHPNVAIRLNNLAGLLKDTDWLGEAEPLMRRAVEILEKSLGPDHPRTKMSRRNLAILLGES